jgi:cell shape-determining protein MreD
MDHRKRRRLEEQIAQELLLMVALISLALVQTSVLPRPYAIVPNLLLVLVVCQGLISEPDIAVRWALYSGVGLDLCSGAMLGSHAMALLCAALAATLPLAWLNRNNWMLPLAGVALGSLIYHGILVVMLVIERGWFDVQPYLLVVALPDIAAALIPALPLYLILRWDRARRRGELAIDIY